MATSRFSGPLLLALVSLIWAFSFGMIKRWLGGLDSTAVSVLRVGFALLVFLPLLRLNAVRAPERFKLLLIGALQFGLMYVLYLRAFQYLRAYEVVLFTIFTPLYVALANHWTGHGKGSRIYLAVALATVGAGVVVWSSPSSRELLKGFGLMQVSNLCFAAGQIAYRQWRANHPELRDQHVFGWLYLGAVLLAGGYSSLMTDWSAFRPSATQWLVLAYLGIIASGLGFFWWNVGATRVKGATLAVFNNAKLPLGVACSLLIYREPVDVPRLVIGGGLVLAAILIAERAPTAA